MKKKIKKVMEILITLIGTLLAIYIGGYWLLLRPLHNLYVGYTQHMITAHLLLNSFVRIFLSTTIFGAIWCLFDLFAGFFREDENES